MYDEAYLAVKELVDENPDAFETMIKRMAQGPEDANFSEDTKAAEKPWKVMKAGDES